MKERPILFSGAMVRAILEGRKTQTRRLLKDEILSRPPYFFSGEVATSLGYPASEGFFWAGFRHKADWRNVSHPDLLGSACYVKCPYGMPGDHLWVKETFSAHSAFGPNGRKSYRADIPSGKEPHGLHWKPSIFMPRAASRILLEIVAVRVERLQQISEADAKAEGVTPTRYSCQLGERGSVEIFSAENEPAPKLLGAEITAVGIQATITKVEPCYAKAYAELWDSINGEGAWTLNPWVWVVEFRRITP